MAAIIESIEGCRNAQDDIIIWADTPELLEKKKNNWSSASCQTVRIKTEPIQVSI